MDDADTYTNPVYPEAFPDPFVLRHGDGYYAYGTDLRRAGGRVIPLLYSRDLVEWESLGDALEPIAEPWALDYWAPEVAERDGTFFRYFPAGTDDKHHQVRVATADRPEGPFRDQGRILTGDDPFTIDAHPFRDDDGEWYLYYARDFLDGERVGTAVVVDRLVDMLSLGGDRRTALRANADWQIYERARLMYGSTYDWHTIEGPFVLKRDGRYWCFYSGGAWRTPLYGVSVAVADSPLGPFLDPTTGGPSILRSAPGFVGPGHNSVVQGPDGEHYLVYHAWDEAQTARRMCIDRLEWGPEGPRAVAPSTSPRRRPLATSRGG
jgi:beta-xylosidase